MEEEASIILNETYIVYEPSTDDYIINAFFILGSGLTFICNLIIIYVMVRNKRMQTRTNVLLMNWAINDCFFIVTSPWLIGAILQLVGNATEHEALYRWGMLFEMVFQFNCAVLLTIMISNTLMNLRAEPGPFVIATFYGFSVCILISEIIFTLCDVSFSILICIVFINLLCVVAMLLFKEINKCVKSLKDPLSDCTVFRLNLARIYYYGGAVSLISVEMSHFIRRPYVFHLIFKILCLTRHFTGLYFFVYTVLVDKEFRACLFDLIGQNRIVYKTDTEANFDELDDDFSQDTCLDNDRNDRIA